MSRDSEQRQLDNLHESISLNSMATKVAIITGGGESHLDPIITIYT